MSSIDFTKIRKTAPARGAVWDLLEQWCKHHDPAQPIVVLELVRDLHNEVAPATLMDAVTEMILSGAVEKRYRVMDPSMKTLLPDDYVERSDIPNVVHNNWDKPISVGPDDIRLVLCPS